MSARYVERDDRPRFIVRDKRGVDPECGHCLSAEDAYGDLASAIMFRSDRGEYPNDPDYERWARVRDRLARWLAWSDSARSTPSKEPSP